MAVTLTTLESNLQTKMNNTSGTTDAQEFLLLSKSVEALNPSIAVQDVIDEGTTQVAAVTAEGTTQVGLVQTEGATQVAAVQAAGAGYATQADIDASVSALVDTAPATLDTLNELAAALGDDANFSTTVTNSIATKLPLAGGTMTGNVTYNDNIQAQFGTNVDAHLRHDGVNFSLTNNTGHYLHYAPSGSNHIFHTGGTQRVTIGDNGISGSYTNLHPEVTSTSAAATSQTFDMNDPMTHMTMTAATTFTATNLAAGKTSMMVLDTTATPYTPSWVSDIKWPDATEPTWSDHRYWIVSFTCLNGTTTLASASGYTV